MNVSLISSIIRINHLKDNNYETKGIIGTIYGEENFINNFMNFFNFLIY